MYTFTFSQLLLILPKIYTGWMSATSLILQVVGFLLPSVQDHFLK